jgi:hypothetical protein
MGEWNSRSGGFRTAAGRLGRAFSAKGAGCGDGATASPGEAEGP